MAGMACAMGATLMGAQKLLGKYKTLILQQGWEPIHYHEPHEMCIIADGPQNQLICPKILPFLTTRKSDFF